LNVHAVPFKGGDERDLGNYRGISLLSIIDKIFKTILKNRVSAFLEERNELAEEQGGFRKGRGCAEHIFTLKEILRMRKGRKTFCCFLDVKKAYDRVWRDGLWVRLWDVGVRGKMWRVIKNSYDGVASCILLGSKRTRWFGIVRQGCVLSPLLYDMFINGLIVVVKASKLGVAVGDGFRLAILLFSDDIV
jgi:hypothetical protein